MHPQRELVAKSLILTAHAVRHDQGQPSGVHLGTSPTALSRMQSKKAEMNSARLRNESVHGCYESANTSPEEEHSLSDFRLRNRWLKVHSPPSQHLTRPDCALTHCLQRKSQVQRRQDQSGSPP